MTNYDEPIYILITQCLQNNFFLSTENRLKVPRELALRMLLSSESIQETADTDKLVKHQGNRLQIASEALEAGPLYQFFSATINDDRKNHLHVIHIKDWHTPSRGYDFERERYGSHCEAGTWEAAPIDGFDQFLQPWTLSPGNEQAALSVNGFTQGNTTYYNVLSNSLFDFQPIDGEKSQLSKILDQLILDEGQPMHPVYIVVIGVLTDIKVKLLLTGLRSHYDLNNLVLSDVLTTSITLERHLSGLDFADKVLSVEIIHSLNALVSVLYPRHPDDIPKEIFGDMPNFRNYRSYYLDKQNVLSFQDEKLLQYVELTGKRGADVYQTIFRTNRWLTYFGVGFLLLALILAAARIVDPEKYDTDALVLITGGLSIVQLITVYFSRPLERIQENLNNLVRLRNYLETYSTITALMRHHLTIPERLQTDDFDDLKRQLDLVQDMAGKMSANFTDIQLGDKKSDGDDEDAPSLPPIGG